MTSEELETPEDRRRRNILILALKRAVQATFDAEAWRELGYLTNTIDYISGHPRLLRSLSWGDDDYGGNVLSAIETILREDPANLQVLLRFRGIEDWIRKNEPGVHAEFYGSTGPSLEAVSAAERVAQGFDVHDYIRRIRESLEGDKDPALALGSTKELIESVLKQVLGLRGTKIGDEDMPRLLKQAQASLGLEPKDVDTSAPGGDAFRRLLGSLAQIVVATTELRNLYGTGHGKTGVPPIDPAAARLAVAAGSALAAYLMERRDQLKRGDKTTW